MLASDEGCRDKRLRALRTERSEVVASTKQLSVVLYAAKPPRMQSIRQARSEPSRVYRGDRTRLCDGGETSA